MIFPSDIRDLRESFLVLRGAVVNWTEDRQHGLTPTLDSLARAQRTADNAICLLSALDPHHCPPATVIFDDREVPALETTR